MKQACRPLSWSLCPSVPVPSLHLLYSTHLYDKSLCFLPKHMWVSENPPVPFYCADLGCKPKRNYYSLKPPGIVANPPSVTQLDPIYHP